MQGNPDEAGGTGGEKVPSKNPTMSTDEKETEKIVYEEGLAVWGKMKMSQDWSHASPGKIVEVQDDGKCVKYHVSFPVWNQTAWLSSPNVRPFQVWIVPPPRITFPN